MKYTVSAGSETRDNNGIICSIHTTVGDTMRIVERDNGRYKIRRTNSTGSSWIWDLSVEAFNSVQEAAAAMVSGNVKFKLGG